MLNINLTEYDYVLPEEKIAQYPVNERDNSKLLIYKKGKITDDVFRNIENHLPSDSLLVFNNSSVIRARILFNKISGAEIEVFCLEPLLPGEYQNTFISSPPVEWKCIVGNLKKWKNSRIYKFFKYNGKNYEFTAEKVREEDDGWRIRFSWNCPGLFFGEVIKIVGHIPLPPYIDREDEDADEIRYQTVYSSIKGSVAAPTAGLHFTECILNKLKTKGIQSTEITLHVGAGTFQPVKSVNILNHKMHGEHFLVTKKTIETLLANSGRIIPVGTTSVRTIESLYWLGIKAINNPQGSEPVLFLDQWESYFMNTKISPQSALEALLNCLRPDDTIHASTSLIIVPGYNFKIINGMITNFHQPRSTLLLLISAWIGKDWEKIYNYALENKFRFLSYGDSSLLIR
jgi:S-adenosylmethionine:tRNA ribosyltransferase-isomerase